MGKKTAGTLIKYDRLSVRVHGVLTIVSFFVFLMAGILAEHVHPVFGVLVFAMPLLTVTFGVYWCAGYLYLRRLKKFGYTIPDKRKDYDCLLEKLPRENGITERTPCNRRSKVFALICAGIWICMWGVNIWYYYTWHFMEDSAIAMFVLMILADVYWLIQALQFRKQMSNETYKEDVEIEKNKKSRMSPEYAVFLVLFMLLITCVVKHTVFSMTEYVYRGQVEAEQGKAEVVTVSDFSE